MSIDFEREPMLDMYIFGSTQLLEQLEITILDSEGAADARIPRSMKFSGLCTQSRVLLQ